MALALPRSNKCLVKNSDCWTAIRGEKSKEAKIVGQIKECPTKKLGKGEIGGKVMKLPPPSRHDYCRRDGRLSFLAMARPMPSGMWYYSLHQSPTWKYQVAVRQISEIWLCFSNHHLKSDKFWGQILCWCLTRAQSPRDTCCVDHCGLELSVMMEIFYIICAVSFKYLTTCSHWAHEM